jgi:molybdenum cofactor cytidylyltransferase
MEAIQSGDATRPIGGIILAAGSSVRYGEDKRLQQLSSGSTLLETTTRSAMDSIQRLLVVLRKEDEFGDRLNTLVNDRYIQFYRAPDSADGMGSSLANAIHKAAKWQAAMVLLGDMPYIQQCTFDAIIAAYKPDTGAIIVPTTNGQQGHPVLFDQCYFDEISALTGDLGARCILEAHQDKIIEVPVNDAGILLDIDTPEDMLSCSSLAGPSNS